MTYELGTSTYPFGQDIEFWIYPLVDNEPAVIAANVQSQTPDIYVFDSAGVPSLSVARAGTGALQHITSMTWDAGKNAWKCTITAIEDPDPTSTQDIRTYFVAANFILKLGDNTKQTVILPLELGRVRAQQKNVSVTYSDLAAMFPQINGCSTPAQQTAQIAQAVDDVKARLKSKGYEWSKINRLDALNRAVTLRAISLIMVSQIKSGNDKYAIKYSEYKGMYDSEMESIQLEYDENHDGMPEQKVVPASSSLWVMR